MLYKYVFSVIVGRKEQWFFKYVLCIQFITTGAAEKISCNMYFVFRSQRFVTYYNATFLFRLFSNFFEIFVTKFQIVFSIQP